MEQTLDRVVLITGGNRGIGRAIAERFIADGDRVAVTTRNGQAPSGALALTCDITDTDAVNAAFDLVESELGPVTVCVANAGITRDGLLLRMSDDDFSSVLDANLHGAFRVARRAARPMVRARSGRLIFVSSVVAMLGSAGQVNYAAAKAGLIGLARSMARELGPRGITANVVAPGFVETDMTAGLEPERRTAILSQVPLGRYATSAEIAAVIEFLASDAAAYVTGAVIPVDGGLGMGH